MRTFQAVASPSPRHPHPHPKPKRFVVRERTMEDAVVAASRKLGPGWHYTIRSPTGAAQDGWT